MNVRPIDRLGLPRVKRSHAFLLWQRRQLARECYRRREQICLWFAGSPKTAGRDVRFGSRLCENFEEQGVPDASSFVRFVAAEFATE